MQRALELARRGIGVSSPNPAVGCVILDRDGQVAGEGWHEYDLLDHAEVAALKVATRHAGEQLRGGTAYVTLEPCNHTGRTGPCTEALIAAGISRVVAATIDPTPAVAGHGNHLPPRLRRLRADGMRHRIGHRSMHPRAEQPPAADLRHVRVVPEESAIFAGNKVVGQLGAYYRVGDFNVQVTRGKLVWVAPLEFQGVVQWLSRGTSPGVIVVSAEDPDEQAEVVAGDAEAMTSVAAGIVGSPGQPASERRRRVRA